MTSIDAIARRVATIALILPVCLLAQSNPQTAPLDPVKLAAQDSHQNLLISADPFLTAGRYKGIFGKKAPYDSGIAAIDVYFRNDNDRPIRLNPDTIELIISQPDQDRQRLGPLAPEDVADRTILNKASDPTIRRRLPIPSTGIPSSRSKDWNEMVTSLRAVALGSAVLPPHVTTHGFLFFDVNHDFDAIHYAHLYIPDLAFMGSNEALFFFEINLAAPAPK